MSRIKIECYEKDKRAIFMCLVGNDEWCPFEVRFCDDDIDCVDCIEKNVEFVIKEESNE